MCINKESCGNNLEIRGTVRQVLLSPGGDIPDSSVEFVRLMIAYNVLSTLHHYFFKAMRQPRCESQQDHFRIGDQVVFLPIVCGALKEAYDCYQSIESDIDATLQNHTEAKDARDCRTEFKDLMSGPMDANGIYRRVIKHVRDKSGAHWDKREIKKCLRKEIESTRSVVFAVSSGLKEGDVLSLRYPYADEAHNAISWSFLRSEEPGMDRGELEKAVSDIARASGMFMAIAEAYVACKLKEAGCNS
jgi:hypothetical protein